MYVRLFDEEGKYLHEEFIPNSPEPPQLYIWGNRFFTYQYSVDVDKDGVDHYHYKEIFGFTFIII